MRHPAMKLLAGQKCAGNRNDYRRMKGKLTAELKAHPERGRRNRTVPDTQSDTTAPDKMSEPTD